ncbi:glutathione peroxidase [Tumebacillus permanentifrigoris]|uniref:Glutathione peroxidase n=1 Tax=Tumebacillus permanentifrigoris TaxID=378543 RepID=A0A316E150_9BACL|nr:glutathione peroxidase [Tumebacillus permanentifrigoris]PWK16540.1 glutathione peroxidase [Tumebacillus permanentifrigoris]
MSELYNLSAKLINGESKSFADYEGQVLLIVNTASKCGFTPQYKGLQALYDQYRERGFSVLGFPSNQFAGQEPGNSGDIEEFCQINFGVNFPLYEKSDVKGANINPVFKYLTQNAGGFLTSGVKWNFTKFLVDKKGNVVERYAPTTDPAKIAADIEKLLA